MNTSIKIVSWNVNGIRAAVRKNIMDWVNEDNPDIICFQETRADESQMPSQIMNANSYRKYFSNHEFKKGYSGTALLSKREPENISRGIGIKEFDSEGRFLIARYDKFTLFNVYFPNGKSSPERLDYKLSFYEAFLDYIEKLRSRGRPIIFTGDLNTAHKEIDLARPRQNSHISGFLPVERRWIDKVIEKGYIDTFRIFNKEPGNYTWWSMRSRARERNVGWRLDYFFVSPDLKPYIKNSEIYPRVKGSDHCPVALTLDFSQNSS
ncbi:MAG: exodeoxyribonuclease III [Elusimicrobiota bacterium]